MFGLQSRDSKTPNVAVRSATPTGVGTIQGHSRPAMPAASSEQPGPVAMSDDVSSNPIAVESPRLSKPLVSQQKQPFPLQPHKSIFPPTFRHVALFEDISAFVKETPRSPMYAFVPHIHILLYLQTIVLPQHYALIRDSLQLEAQLLIRATKPATRSNVPGLDTVFAQLMLSILEKHNYKQSRYLPIEIYSEYTTTLYYAWILRIANILNQYPLDAKRMIAFLEECKKWSTFFSDFGWIGAYTQIPQRKEHGWLALKTLVFYTSLERISTDQIVKRFVDIFTKSFPRLIKASENTVVRSEQTNLATVDQKRSQLALTEEAHYWIRKWDDPFISTLLVILTTFPYTFSRIDEQALFGLEFAIFIATFVSLSVSEAEEKAPNTKNAGSTGVQSNIGAAISTTMKAIQTYVDRWIKLVQRNMSGGMAGFHLRQVLLSKNKNVLPFESNLSLIETSSRQFLLWLTTRDNFESFQDDMAKYESAIVTNYLFPNRHLYYFPLSWEASYSPGAEVQAVYQEVAADSRINFEKGAVKRELIRSRQFYHPGLTPAMCVNLFQFQDIVPEICLSNDFADLNVDAEKHTVIEPYSRTGQFKLSMHEFDSSGIGSLKEKPIEYTETAVRMLDAGYCAKKRYIAFKIREKLHILIALWDLKENVLELFDTSYRHYSDDRGVIPQAVLKFFRPVEDPPVFVIVNKTEDLQAGNPKDIYCQTYIYYYLYERVKRKRDGTEIVTNLGKLKPEQRVLLMQRFNEFLRWDTTLKRQFPGFDVPKQLI